MNDALLHEPDRKTELSFAYLGALCAYVGYTCQRGPEPDRGSVDATVRAGGTMNPQFDVQLKATAVPDRKEDGLHFRLLANNYADWRSQSGRPRFSSLCWSCPPASKTG